MKKLINESETTYRCITWIPLPKNKEKIYKVKQTL